MPNAPAVESVPEFVPQSGLQAGSEFYDEPYLETCCRSTLHRLLLCASAGRPTGLKDQPCLERLERLGLSELREDGRFVITQDGLKRHRSEIGATD